jgi:hypothetical protein
MGPPTSVVSVEHSPWMPLERESCTAAQMEIAGICAKMHRAECSCCTRLISPPVHKSPKSSCRDFLARGCGPEQQALLQMIGTLIESAPGELLSGEGNPGLAVTGGSGHA